MAWPTCEGPHASSYLHTTRRLPSPRHYFPASLYALAFTLFRSCLHVVHVIPILFLLYRVPATMCYKLSFFKTSFSTHHTCLPTPSPITKLKIRRHLVFDFGPTTAQTQITWTLAPGPTFGVLPLEHIFFCFGSRVLANSYLS